MKTFISDLIPKLQRFSQRLDNLTLLINQHWVVIDDINNIKSVYIFRTNNELLISQNGKIEKARWEYLGNNSLLIDKKEDSYLFKHGFFDENILALKIDNKDEYAILINENKYNDELNSIENVIDFLTNKYVSPLVRKKIEDSTGINIEPTKKITETKIVFKTFKTDKGNLEIEQFKSFDSINYEGQKTIKEGQKALLNGQPAPDGKYKIGFMHFVHIKNALVSLITPY